MDKDKKYYHRSDLLIGYSVLLLLGGGMSDRVRGADIADFLKQNGGLGVLVMIDKQKGTIHSEFKNKLHVSRATVTKRLETADELGLIEVSRLSEDHGNAKRYVLTEMGRVLRVALESMGLRETYKRYVELDQALADSTDEIVDWIHDTPEIWAEKTFASEFTFREEFQNEEIFPGDDVPDGFVRYIEGELSIRERAKRGLEREKKKRQRRFGDGENPPDSGGQEDEDE